MQIVTAAMLLALTLRAPLMPLYEVLGGAKACTWIPFKGSRVHHYRSDTTASPDGQFLVEHNFNRGISEMIALTYDSRAKHYVRTRLSRDGIYEVAVSAGPHRGEWVWNNMSVGDSRKPYAIILRSSSASAYAFTYSNGPGVGSCSAIHR